VWLTADGVPVLDHDGTVRTGLGRRRPILSLPRAQLPSHVPSLADLYDACGAEYELSLDVKDPTVVDAVLAEARAAGALGRLWLCHHDWKVLAMWRPLSADVRLVDSTRIRRIRDGAERRAASLADAGIDAVNMHASDWTGGLVALFHRFERCCFGWDAQLPRVLVELLVMGLDGVYSDHVDRLVAALAEVAR
jgi:glycerophosphoryl diester phosphodiesterase